ncbi:MAG: amino acid--tRNA ligase-related protein, partial [Coriobacteriales bacterium]|nr:amino acid--tRNA ligase-related protein [Coriobacteriales bacterium]
MAESTPVNTNDERAMRRAKRQALIDAGVNPYPISSTINTCVSELATTYAELEAGGIGPEDEAYYLAGRIRGKRGHGKLSFIDLEDKTGQIQLFCRINNMDQATWDLIGQLDVGDIVEARGTIMRTKRGELSLMVAGLRLLSKSLRPLPEKFHGLSDREMRYRQRYVDLIMNPEVKDTFVKRSRIISAIRHYMEEQGYLEVETPILQETLGGANARPFTTHFNVLDQDCYLR